MRHLGLMHDVQERRCEGIELDEWRIASLRRGESLVTSEPFQEAVKGLFVRLGGWRGTTPCKRRCGKRGDEGQQVLFEYLFDLIIMRMHEILTFSCIWPMNESKL